MTFTANPQWPEITENLLPGQDAKDRPDLVVRVFNLKRKALCEDLKAQFGRFLGMFWTIEYQKRGLPHLHCLLFLHRDDTFSDRYRIDDLIRAELPDPALDPDGLLRAVVQSPLVPGPCGLSIRRRPVCNRISEARAGRVRNHSLSGSARK